MLFGDFLSNLQKLNKNLWVDTEHKVDTIHPAFKCAGLYLNDRHLMAVSLGNVQECSVFAVKCPGLSGKSNEYVDCDYIFAAGGGKLHTKPLGRGYLAVLESLLKQGLIDREKAESMFSCTLKTYKESSRVRYLDYWPEGT